MTSDVVGGGSGYRFGTAVGREESFYSVVLIRFSKFANFFFKNKHFNKYWRRL